MAAAGGRAVRLDSRLGPAVLDQLRCCCRRGLPPTPLLLLLLLLEAVAAAAAVGTGVARLGMDTRVLGMVEDRCCIRRSSLCCRSFTSPCITCAHRWATGCVCWVL